MFEANKSRAREALAMLLLHDDQGKTIKAISYFNTMEIYPGEQPDSRHTALTLRLLSHVHPGQSERMMADRIGSKLRHFRSIHQKTKIPYDQMVSPYLLLPLASCLPFLYPDHPDLTRIQLFFDDEHRNTETESLGVTMQLVPSSGTDRALLQAGLALWRKRRGIRVV